MLKEVMLVLTGGICASLGGAVLGWFQARRARKTRMEETLGEKQVEAYEDAANTVSTLRSLLDRKDFPELLQYTESRERWFLKNHLILPQEFKVRWVSFKLALKKLVTLLEETTPESETEQAETQNRKKELTSLLNELAREAEEKILAELGIPSGQLYRLPE